MPATRCHRPIARGLVASRERAAGKGRWRRGTLPHTPQPMNPAQRSPHRHPLIVFPNIRWTICGGRVQDEAAREKGDGHIARGFGGGASGSGGPGFYVIWFKPFFSIAGTGHKWGLDVAMSRTPLGSGRAPGPVAHCIDSISPASALTGLACNILRQVAI